MSSINKAISNAKKQSKGQVKAITKKASAKVKKSK